MAKLNSRLAAGATPQQEAGALELASLGLFFCMVFTLVGIKLWWFRHRLAFDHSGSTATCSGMRSGDRSSAMSSTRTKKQTAKDKRTSQQVRQPVKVYGAFRKKQEDDFDSDEQSKLLAQEAASLPNQRQHPRGSPLKLQHELPGNNKGCRLILVDDHLHRIPLPPLRDPPAPPIVKSQSIHQAAKEPAAVTQTNSEKLLRQETKSMRAALKVKLENEDINEKRGKSDQLWEQMERDIQDFGESCIEEKFNEIGKSYEATEGRFLNLNTVDRKSIDEDCVNFEDLRIQEEDKRQPEDRRRSDFVKRTATEQRQVHFGLIEVNEDNNQKSSSKINERRPTGFVRLTDLKQLNCRFKTSEHESENGNEDENGKNKDSDESSEAGLRNKPSKLKQRRPTGFVWNSEL